MLKLTKTGIGLLTNQYRSVLRKCFLLNLGVFVSSTLLPVFTPNISFAVDCSTITSSSSASDIASCIGSFRGIPISTLDLTEGYYNNGNSTTSRWSSGVAVSVRNWVNADTYYLHNQQITHNATVGYHTITPSATIADNLAALDQLIGGYPVYSGTTYANRSFLRSYKENNANVNSMDTGAPILTNLVHLDYVLGQLPSGTYVSNMQSMGENVKALDTAIGAKIASDGHYIKKSDTNSVTANLSALDYALYNYYYTKTEADAEYALLEAAIGDVDDKVEDVDDKVDAVEAKIGDLNETGIAGNDVATQLKYILENGSTGGTGVSLSTLGYIGANTPYLNTTNNAMNFSSTYTIGGNLSTLANQIKTNETNISNLSSRVNLLGSYSNGGADISENYAKVIGNTSIVTNLDNLKNDGNIVKAYATPATLNNKSYTVEIGQHMDGLSDRRYRIQVVAPSQEEAVKLAKDTISESWSDSTMNMTATNINGQEYSYQMYNNKYGYETTNFSNYLGAQDTPSEGIDKFNAAIQSSSDVTVTENNYTVSFHSNEYPVYVFTMDVSASNESEAFTKAKELMSESWFKTNDVSFNNLYINRNPGSYPGHSAWQSVSLENTPTIIEDGDKGTSESYTLGSHTIIENIALLDSAIGDLSATGVSGNSVAVQLQLLGEVGSEALGQKIGSWSTTKDSISQTLGEETKKYGYLTAFEYDSENEQYVGTVGDNLTALDAALSLTAKDLDALTYQLYNYYYTKTEADARYAKLSGNNIFTGKSIYSDSNGNQNILLTGKDGYGELWLGDREGHEIATLLTAYGFKLNNSGDVATGIDFAANVTEGTTNAAHLATIGAVNQLLNYYYTFRVDETVEMIESAKELKTSFPVILRSAEHDVRISARSAARIDTGLKSGDHHVASLRSSR